MANAPTAQWEPLRCLRIFGFTPTMTGTHRRRAGEKKKAEQKEGGSGPGFFFFFSNRRRHPDTEWVVVWLGRRTPRETEWPDARSNPGGPTPVYHPESRRKGP